MARLVLKGVRSGDQLFVDDIRIPVSEPPGTWDLTPGSHRLRLVAGNQELVADPRSLQSECNRGSQPGGLQTACSGHIPGAGRLETRIQRGRHSCGGEIPSRLSQIRPSAHKPNRSSKSLYWSRASSSGSIRDFQEYAAKYASPPGPHLQAAQAEIARLEWEAIQNTTDPLANQKVCRSESKRPVSRPRSDSA